MNLGIKGRKALVLASSKGLGKGVAKALCLEGVDVMLCGRNAESLRETAAELMQANQGTVHYTSGDVSKREDIQAIISTAKAKLGQIDILVTNTGGPPPGRLMDTDLDQWEHAYRLLLESAVAAIQGVVPDMKHQGWGRIITISSQAIKQPVDGLILSNAVRSSLLGLVKSLSIELGPHNITVNNLLPGYTRTDRLTSLMAANPHMSQIVDEIPLRRIGEVDEFASAAVFLASECASYISGVSLPVDGGWIKGV
jgi:Dehydrogenases with different specificities (related to short-chain alcohol dehydrogenases)